jgi:acyl-CoA synthetase (AMP-forming)/AMP-acid ligase II
MSAYLTQAAAVTAALAELNVHPHDRVLITLPDGPDFAAAFAGVIQHGAVPLPVNPLLSVHDVITVTAAQARLMLVPADQLDALANLDAKPPLLVNGPQGPWAAVFRLR